MDWIRFKMLTRWLTFMAFLAGSANSRSADPNRRAVTVAATCRVKGQPEVELVLNCGDGKHEGWVQFWHTPSGDLQPSSGHTSSVFVHHNGSLVIPRPSLLHRGLYYCVLQHSEGSTLWPYELHVGRINQNTDDKNEQDNSRAAHRTRRTVGNDEVKDGGPDGMFVGAVVASVLVTFVVGFSAGALTRSYVLRCWHAIITRLRSPKRRRQADVPDHGSQVVITLPPMHESHTFETETTRNESPVCVNLGSRASVTTPSPPAKPKRSFRNREEEKMRDAAAYLEGCDYAEEKMEEARGGVRAMKGSDEEETTQSFFYLEDEELQSETDEDKILDEREEKEEAGGGVEAFKGSDEEETTQGFFYLEDEELQSETDEDKILDEREQEEGEPEKRSEEEVRGEKEEEKTGVRETECCEELDQSSAGDERGGENKETTMEDEEATSSSAPRRRSRVIRVYQYDEEGQKYCHLPDLEPEGPEPVPKLRQRSLSLTRLNAIMATATAGPMEEREGEERPHFHMEI